MLYMLLIKTFSSKITSISYTTNQLFNASTLVSFTLDASIGTPTTDLSSGCRCRKFLTHSWPKGPLFWSCGLINGGGSIPVDNRDRMASAISRTRLYWGEYLVLVNRVTHWTNSSSSLGDNFCKC